jgi:hypothetical protein
MRVRRTRRRAGLGEGRGSNPRRHGRGPGAPAIRCPCPGPGPGPVLPTGGFEPSTRSWPGRVGTRVALSLAVAGVGPRWSVGFETSNNTIALLNSATKAGNLRRNQHSRGVLGAVFERCVRAQRPPLEEADCDSKPAPRGRARRRAVLARAQASPSRISLSLSRSPVADRPRPLHQRSREQ